MRRDLAYLADILDSARLAIGYLRNVSRTAFASDVQLQDAVIRRLEIIGEAARRISDEGRQSYPQLPWQQMVGMRNVMVHQYDAVDLAIIWDTVSTDLPGLVEDIERILAGED